MKTSSLLSGALATSVLPIALGAALLNRRFAASLPERLVRGTWKDFEQTPLREAIWIHAASLGEIEGVVPVARELARRGYAKKLFISTTSSTGQEAASRKGLALRTCLLPFDHPWFIAKALRRVKPSVMVIFETELWPNLLYALHRRDVPVVIINGRISDKSIERYRYAKPFLGAALRQISMVLAQSASDRERFISLGAMPDRVVVSGCTKFDQSVSEEDLAAVSRLRQELRLSEGVPCIVCGSIRPGEETILLGAFRRVKERFPECRLIAAPRHPERFEDMARALSAAGIPFARRSRQGNFEQADVVLLDTLGELRHAYALGSIAFIGGTLVPIGGHNPFEPAPFAVPITLGRYTENVRNALDILRTFGAVREVESEQDLASAWGDLLSDAQTRQIAGEGAYAAWQSQLGATERAVIEIERYIARSSGRELERSHGIV